MKHICMIAAILTGLGVAACARVETRVTRTQTLQADVSYNVRHIQVSVPQTLEVVEKNYLYPRGDIIWRGDLRGDRRAQVKAIFETAMQRGVSELPNQGVPAHLIVEVTRFHALSNSARRTIGGVHALQFKMVLRNPQTGKDLGPTWFVKADMLAYGGKKASIAITAGQTQKVRITDHLAEVIKLMLTDPQSFAPTELGIVGAINQS